MIRTNSKRVASIEYYPSLLAFGYRASKVNWGGGHFTKYVNIYFLFWGWHSSQSFIDTEYATKNTQ